MHPTRYPTDVSGGGLVGTLFDGHNIILVCPSTQKEISMLMISNNLLKILQFASEIRIVLDLLSIKFVAYDKRIAQP